MMINACQKVAEILLVEDNPVDVMVAQDALTEAKMCNKVHVAEDGEEALDFLTDGANMLTRHVRTSSSWT